MLGTVTKQIFVRSSIRGITLPQWSSCAFRCKQGQAQNNQDCQFFQVSLYSNILCEFLPNHWTELNWTQTDPSLRFRSVLLSASWHHDSGRMSMHDYTIFLQIIEQNLIEPRPTHDYDLAVGCWVPVDTMTVAGQDVNAWLRLGVWQWLRWSWHATKLAGACVLPGCYTAPNRT